MSTEAQITAEGQAPKAPDAATLVARYLKLTPVLWVLGLNMILGGPLTIWLAYRRWPTARAVNAIFAAWCLVACAQAVSVVVNWARLGESAGTLPGRLLAFTIIGWIFLGLSICAGYAWRLSNSQLVRGTMFLGLYVICGTGIAFLLQFAGGIAELEFRTPTGWLLGSSPTAEFYTNVQLYLSDPASFGLPRLVLFYPWSTALGFAGVCICLIATCERNLGWRMTGLAGGLAAVVFSFSRATIAILPVAFLVVALLRARPAVLLCLLVFVAVVGLALLALDINPVFVVNEALETLRESRAGSSQARDLIYEYSWLGFIDSPVFGLGWIGESVIRQEMLPVGSHSTFFGTLYTGGLLTFGALTCATLLTLSLVAANARRSRAAAVAVGILLSCVMFSYGEGFYNIVLPCVFALYFVGGSLAPSAVDGADVEIA